jgi:serine protease Do
MTNKGVHAFMTTERPKPSNRLRLTLAVALLAGAGLTLHNWPVQAQQERNAPVNPESIRHAETLSDAFKQASKLVAPSVVNIRSEVKPPQRTATSNENEPDQGGQSPEDFFRRFFEGMPNSPDMRQFRIGPGAPNPMPRVGEGSGVIIREDGYIVTNNHVVDEATDITVTLDDDREYPAEIVGTDPETDLAVVKIDASGLVPVKYGDSDALEVGEWVLALGSPFGLQHTVTAGIVSAKGRQVGIIRRNLGFAGGFEDFIQTDAAINPGNSGGALVNLYGELIGINAAISTQSGAYDGVGFAIPCNMVKSVVNSLIEKGTVERGWLGVSMQPLTKDLAKSFGHGDAQGVLIAQVIRDTPAEKAGVQEGDIVTKVNGKLVSDQNDLMKTIASMAPGETATLGIIRDGQPTTIEVTLGQRTAEALSRGGQRMAPGAPKANPPTAMGITVRPLTPEIAKQLGTEDRQGVVVSDVDEDSAAAKLGLSGGDIICKVGDTPVTSVEEFTKAMKDQDAGEGLRLQVFSGGSMRFLLLKPE